jgi:hypothetical protein
MREVFKQHRIAVPRVKHAPAALDVAAQWSLLTQFVRAFNAGDVPAAMALLAPDATVSDCDFAQRSVASLEGLAQIEEWLAVRKADRDRLTLPASPSLQPAADAFSATPFTVAQRSNDTLAALGFKRGVWLREPMHVAFDAGSRRISALWLGPVPDQAHLCWRFRAVR